MRRSTLVRRTQCGRVDFAFVLYGGNRKTSRLVVAMPMPGKLLWSVMLSDPALDGELDSAQLVTQCAWFELEGEPCSSLESYLGPLMPNSSRHHGITTMSGRGWYTHCRIHAPRGSRSVVDGARATIAIR